MLVAMVPGPATELKPADQFDMSICLFSERTYDTTSHNGSGNGMVFIAK